MGLISVAFGEPDVGRHLLRDEGEVIVDVVRKHSVAYVKPFLWMLLGAFCWVLAGYVAFEAAWFPMLLGVLILLWALYRAMLLSSDCFVITSMRVFRLHGVFSKSLATMPLHRILDISVAKPLVGRILGYGHFVFESAAQAQGLREIRYVARPDERDLAIQRVVQRSGLRGPRVH